MLNRIERHDITNAVALALVLLLCVFVILRWVGSLASALDGGFWTAEKAATVAAPTEEAVRAANEIRGQHSPNEVSVLVGNGSSGIDGLAGRGAERLTDLGYGTLSPQNYNGEPVANSMIYYAQGYRPDAEAIAILLSLDGRLRMITDDIGVNADGADVVVILGDDALTTPTS